MQIPEAVANISIRRKLLVLLVIIPAVFELVFVLTLAGLLDFAEHKLDVYQNSKAVLIDLQNAVGSLSRHTLSFLMEDRNATAANRKPQVMPMLADLSKDIEVWRSLMPRAAKTRPELKEVLAAAPDLFEDASQFIDQTRHVYDAASLSPSTRPLTLTPGYIRQRGAAGIMAFKPLAKKFLEADQKLETVGFAEIAQFKSVILWSLIGGIFVSVGVTAVTAVIYAKDVVDRLREIENNSQMLAVGGTVKLVEGNDEIAKLNDSVWYAQRVLAEERRREFAILDAADDVLCSLDKRFKFAVLSESARKVWGYAPEDLLGNYIFSILTPESAQASRPLLEVLSTSLGQGEVETRVICRNKEVKDIRWTLNWSSSERLFQCIGHDVTERRNAERAKQRFVSIASHDLRSPLASLQVTLELLADGVLGDLNEDARRLIHDTEEQTSSVITMINDLLEVEKLESTAFVLNLQEMSISGLVRQAIASLPVAATNKAVQISCECGELSTRLDADRMRRVLVTLLNNAVSVSRPRSAVEVKAEIIPGKGARSQLLEIRVDDHGPGMSPEQLSRIFQKFVPVEERGDARKQLLSLEFVVCKAIVEAHGGEISVESPPEGGCSFYLRLPVLHDGKGEQS